MCIIALLQGFVFYASISTLYRTSAGLTLFQISIIESISYILTICLEIPWGILADRIGYRRTMIICSCLYFISKIIFWKANSFFMFLLERILLSIVFAGLSGVDSSILYLSCKEQENQKVFAVYGVMGTVGMLISSLATALFVHDDYRMTAFFTIIPYAIAAILSFFLKEVKNSSSEEKQSTYQIIHAMKETIHEKSLIYLVLAAGLMSEAVHMLTVFLNQPKYESTGMSTSSIALVFTMMTVFSLIEVFSDRITMKKGQEKTGIILFLIQGTAAVILGITSKAAIAVCSVAFIEIAYSLFEPLLSSREHTLIHSSNRAAVFSAAAVMMDLVSAGVDLIIGRAADMSLTCSILVGALLIAAGGFLYHRSFHTGQE
jgi:MFS family permease